VSYSSPRRRESREHTGEHHDEAGETQKRKLKNNTGNQNGYAGDDNENADRNDRVVGLASTLADGRDEICVVLIEIALHLFEESLLLLRKWHPVPLSLGISGPVVEVNSTPREHH